MDELELKQRMRTAKEFEDQKKYLHAIQIYELIKNENPNYYQAYIKLSYIYENVKRPEASIKLLKGYLEDVEENNEVRITLGQTLFRNKRWEEVIDVLALISPEETPRTTFLIGFAHYMLNDFELAEANFKNFVRKNKTSEIVPEAYLYLAKSLIELGRFEEALDYANKHEKIFKANWELHYIYALIYFFKKMYLHAVKHIETAMGLTGESQLLLEWAGKCYLESGDFEKAEAYFLKYLTYAEGSSETFSNLGIACLKNNKSEEALRHFSMALALDPLNEIALKESNKLKNTE